MPPKKKKGKKKGGEDGEPRPETAGDPTDKEELLQQELDQLTKELEELKAKVNSLRQENDWLQKESHRVRVESHEYMSYMEKKTYKRQTTIISLSDQNQREIQDIHTEKQRMLNEFEERKQAMRQILMEKENMMTKTLKELESLQEYKDLQQEQLSTIKDLEKEVLMMRGKHSEAIQQLKAKFLVEKLDHQGDSENKISAMAKEASKEASVCLNSHTQLIKEENRKLRHELLFLIRKTRALHEHKTYLDEQRQQLLMEQQYAQDLKMLKAARQHQVLKSLGMLEKTDEQVEVEAKEEEEELRKRFKNLNL